MTIALRERGVRGVVLDIEGTTTPIAFVSEILFPFARAELRQFLETDLESEEVREVVRLLRAEHADDVARGESPPALHDSPRDAAIASTAAYAEWLMDRDRKSPGLKLLQGLVWERGYDAGLIQGEVFADVPPALARWRAEGLDVAIYSSGSVLAQRLIFATTAAGDLTEFIEHFFDTTVGPKRSPDSYRRIAAEMEVQPDELMFASDVVLELEAARAAGLQVVLCVRPGNPPVSTDGWVVVRSLSELV